MLKTSKTKFSTSCKIVVAAAVIIRIALQMLLPIWARGNYTVDDFMMVQYAHSISCTGWLGGYNYFTLNKVPGYSIFLAISNVLHLPYMFSVGVFYCIACLIFLAAVRKVAKSGKVSVACFLFLLFSPVMFDDNIAQKLYRLAIVPALVIIIVSSYIAVYCERNNGMKKVLPWAILAGVSLAFFCLVREDSMWLMCFVLGATVLLAALFIIENRKKVKFKEYIKFFLCLVLPLVCNNVGTNVLCYVNYRHYGLYVKNDFNQTYFSEVCELLMKIEPEEEISCVYISRDTLNRAFEASPTFSQLKDAMDKRYENPESPGNNNGEFYKAMFVWNLRWAAGESGLYTDPVDTNEFYKQVSEELSAGFDNGTFEERNALVLSPWARPIRDGDIKDIIKYSFKGYKDIITYSDINAAVYMATGLDANLDIMSDVTNQDLLVSEQIYSLKGWIFALDDSEDVAVKIYDDKGNVYIPSFSDSKDVYEHFLDSGHDYANAESCRFDIELTDGSMNITNLYVSVYLDGVNIYDGSIAGLSSLNHEKVKIGIDSNSLKELSDSVNNAVKSTALLNKIVRIYQITWWIAAFGALAAYALELAVNVYKCIKKKRNTNFSSWIVKTGMLLTIWADLVIISVNYFETDAKDFREYYAAGVYPIWQIFVCLSLCTLIHYAGSIFGKPQTEDANTKPTEENMDNINIAITAASYSGNKGAAAMLQSSITQLYEKYGDRLNIKLMSVYPEEDKKQVPFDFVNVVSCTPQQLLFIAFPLAVLHKVFKWISPLRKLIEKNEIVNAYRNTDLVIDEAGISFVDSRGFVMNTYAFVCAAVPLLLGTPVVKYSQALGTFNSKTNRFLAKWILPKISLICARGQGTYDNLRSIGIIDNVKLCADGAFTMKDSPNMAQQVDRICGEDEFYDDNVVGLSISSVVQKKCGKLSIDYRSAMIKFIDGLNAKGYKVLVIANAARIGSEKPRNNDLMICDEVYAGVSDKNMVRWYHREMDAEEIRSYIGKCRFLVASRFHAMIGALQKKVPVLLVGWSHKYQEVLDMFKLGQYAIDFSNLKAESLLEEFDKFVACEEDIRKNIEENYNEVMESSRNNIVYIGEIIDKIAEGKEK